MEEKVDIEKILFNTFKNSLQAFEVYQEEIRQRKETGKAVGRSSSPPTEEEFKDSNPQT